MKIKRKWLGCLALPAALVTVLGVTALCLALTAVHSLRSLEWARADGVYESAQQAAISRIQRNYCGIEKIEIEQAATNSFDGSNPHIWFVLWRVYASNRAPCDPDNPGPALYHQTYENGGSYYLMARDGWVWMPEGRFPELVGFWMKVLGLAGPGDPYHVPRN